MHINELHFISLNVRGLRDRLKRKKIFLWIRQQKCDVAFLQETYWTKEIESFVHSDWNGQSFFNHGTNHSKGVAILIRNGLDLEPVDIISKNDGRLIALRFIINEIQFLCVNIYAPARNTEKDRFYRNFVNWLNRLKQTEDMLITGGDWNCVLKRDQDTRGISRVYLPNIKFKKMIKKNNLVDIWRRFYPDKKQFTWRQMSLNLYSRLDYWLISSSICHLIQSTDIRPAMKCDHNAISLKLKVNDEKRGRGYWKINNDLLSDTIYVTKVNEVINACILETEFNDLNAQQKWEMCKIKIKEVSMNYAKDINSKKKKYYEKLEKEFCYLSEIVDKNPCKESVEKMKKIQEELDKWYTNRSKGAFVRSREKWLEQGEKSTKYFLQLEKRNGKKKEINCVKKGDKLIKQGQKILNEIHRYFKHVYSKEDDCSFSNFKKYVDDSGIKFLTEEEAITCEGPVTEKECFEALLSMGNNKAPGSDGLSAEFYRCFWGDVKQLLVASLNEGYNRQELSFSQKQAIITLIHKKGDRRCLDNWRPISLLNLDYKILARVLSKRLQNVITSLVSHVQSGFLKNRSALDSVRLIQDVIDYCKYTDTPGIIILLDFKKAFDSVCHSFMLYILRKMKFKDSFIRWIKTLYNNALGRVMNNGWISEKFCIERGVRQGCPLSALLFILIAEILACKINCNENVQGIPVQQHDGNEEFKITQYADDTTLLVKSLNSVKHVMDEVNDFGLHAGPKVNWEKTKFIKLSSLNENTLNSDIVFTTIPVKCLGIYIGEDKKEIDILNWENKIQKIKNILNMWRMRNLTYYGKVIIVKILAASQIVYTASAAHTPVSVIKILNKLLYQFIWNSNKEKVKRSVCINSISKGGLNMIDLESKVRSLKLAWIRKFYFNPESQWKSLFKFWTSKISLIPLCFETNCNSKDMSIRCKKLDLPNFYVEFFEAWANLKYVEAKNVRYILNEVIWKNSNIRFQNKMLIYTKWQRAGILKLKHVIDTDGQWKSPEDLSSLIGLQQLMFNFEFSKIKKAIPFHWVQQLRNANHQQNCQTDDPLIQVSTGDLINLQQVNSKHYYAMFVVKKKLLPPVIHFWNFEFKFDTEINWNTIMMFKFGNLFENRIKQFNFKLLHRIIPSRENLCKWKISEDDMCFLCKEKESTKHILLYCKEAKKFWKIVKIVIFHMFKVKIEIDEKILIIGYFIKNKQFLTINVLLVLAEYTIYKNYFKKTSQNNRRINNVATLFNEFKSSVRNYFQWKSKHNDLDREEIHRVLSIVT